MSDFVSSLARSETHSRSAAPSNADIPVNTTGKPTSGPTAASKLPDSRSSLGRKPLPRDRASQRSCTVPDEPDELWDFLGDFA